MSNEYVPFCENGAAPDKHHTGTRTLNRPRGSWVWLKKLLFVTQGCIQILVGIGAAVSGVLFIIRPSGELLQAPVEMLAGSPFRDFLIPGIILFLVNGIGQLLAGVITLRRHRCAAFTGAVSGIGLMIWIFVQVNMIGGGHILQYSYFFIGVVETSLAFMMCNSTTGSRGNITAGNGG